MDSGPLQKLKDEARAKLLRHDRCGGRVWGRVAYVRLHGRRYDSWFSDDPAVPFSEHYNYLYTEQELVSWAARIRRLAEAGDSTFVITNNHFGGKAVVNALQLIRLLTGAKVKVPEPLRQHYPELERIASAPPAGPLLFPTQQQATQVVDQLSWQGLIGTCESLPHDGVHINRQWRNVNNRCLFVDRKRPRQRSPVSRHRDGAWLLGNRKWCWHAAAPAMGSILHLSS
jgi:hypothetical protein